MRSSRAGARPGAMRESKTKELADEDRQIARLEALESPKPSMRLGPGAGDNDAGL